MVANKEKAERELGFGEVGQRGSYLRRLARRAREPSASTPSEAGSGMGAATGEAVMVKSRVPRVRVVRGEDSSINSAKAGALPKSPVMPTAG